MLDAAVAAVDGQPREGQQRMAGAVASALDTGEHLAVQAGTGTGKSLAYLVPAIRHAVCRDATVIVSTATIALQRQLVDRDLPRLAPALAPLLGRDPRFAILKGRRNYLCLHRLHGGPSDEPAEDLVDRVTGVATGELTASAVSAAARRCGRLVDQAVADRLAEAADGLALVLLDAPVGRWDRLPEAVAGALVAVRDASGACRSSLGSERREDPGPATTRKLAIAALDEVSDVAVRLLGSFAEDDPARRRDVVWLGEQGPDGARHGVLRVAPLSVAGLLRERLFGRSTVLLTSATLALG